MTIDRAKGSTGYTCDGLRWDSHHRSDHIIRRSSGEGNGPHMHQAELGEPPIRVLVVDDDQTALQTMVGVLSEFDVVKSSSPLRAVELAREALEMRRPFEVVCSDYQMPSMNGVELLRAMSLLTPQPSCILITGYVEMLRGSYAKASHIVGIIIKPYDPEQLIGLVGRLGRVTRLRRSIDRMAERVSARRG